MTDRRYRVRFQKHLTVHNGHEPQAVPNHATPYYSHDTGCRNVVCSSSRYQPSVFIVRQSATGPGGGNETLATPPSEPANLFRTTASYHARYRAGYPDAFFRHIIARFALDGTQRLPDLGCGTGQLTLPLAASVAASIGIDPEPEMLAEAEMAATRAGITKITWQQGSALRLSPYAVAVVGSDYSAIRRYW